ncbi:MAG: hypothetical protein JWO93_176 [Micrococcaceae bacterium]|nr:hypothetical protein [Micrococcaceae bacterium]
MTTTGSIRNVALLGTAALAIAALAGCSTSGSPSAAGSTSAAAATTAATSTPSATPKPTSPAPTATTEPPATATRTGEPAAAPALCTATQLTGALDDSGGGAAGSVYMSLQVTNSSPTPCILDGYPGVSLVANGNGTQLGAPADRDPALPSSGPITLVPGGVAAAQLRYSQAANYQSCDQVPADGLRVYPPSATDALYIAHPLTGCSDPSLVLLTIGAFQHA